MLVDEFLARYQEAKTNFRIRFNEVEDDEGSRWIFRNLLFVRYEGLELLNCDLLGRQLQLVADSLDFRRNLMFHHGSIP